MFYTSNKTDIEKIIEHFNLKGHGEYSIKGLKTFTGREGVGFNTNLYHGAKKICFVYDDASGGPVNFEIGYNEPEFIAFREWVSSLSLAMESEYFDDGLPLDEELFIGELVSNALALKQVKAKIGKCLCFIAPDTEPGSFSVVDFKGSSGTAKQSRENLAPASNIYSDWMSKHKESGIVLNGSVQEVERALASDPTIGYIDYIKPDKEAKVDYISM